MPTEKPAKTFFKLYFNIFHCICLSNTCSRKMFYEQKTCLMASAIEDIHVQVESWQRNSQQLPKWKGGKKALTRTWLVCSSLSNSSIMVTVTLKSAAISRSWKTKHIKREVNRTRHIPNDSWSSFIMIKSPVYANTQSLHTWSKVQQNCVDPETTKVTQGNK